jgi:hypothetical protein
MRRVRLAGVHAESQFGKVGCLRRERLGARATIDESAAAEHWRPSPVAARFRDWIQPRDDACGRLHGKRTCATLLLGPASEGPGRTRQASKAAHSRSVLRGERSGRARGCALPD